MNIRITMAEMAPQPKLMINVPHSGILSKPSTTMSVNNYTVNIKQVLNALASQDEAWTVTAVNCSMKYLIAKKLTL